MKKIAVIGDKILNVDYTLVETNSKDLSDTLKKTLKSKSIDFKKFNKDGERDMPLPVDIYEYQNFFMLEKENGEIILLDGFRRLLWNDSINHDILVRLYKEKDMSQLDILKLLVSLNHTKFFGGIGNFYDRGFALGVYLVFNLDITKIYKSFNGYLTVKDTKYGYSVSRMYANDAAVSVESKVKSKDFIADMKFLETIADADIIDTDEIFGAFIYDIRKNNPELVFDAENFISKVKSNMILLKQIESFKKSKDNRGNDIGNKMFEMFTNIILNKEGEKSFIERETEIKEAITKMKKEKEWFNYTGNKKYSFSMQSNLRDKNDKLYYTLGVEGAIKAYYKEHGKYPAVKVFVLPSEKPLLKEGVYDDFEIVGFTKGSHLMSTWNIIDVKRGDATLKRSFMKDNRHDLSCIESRDWNNRTSNEIVLFVKDLDFELESK